MKARWCRAVSVVVVAWTLWGCGGGGGGEQSYAHPKITLVWPERTRAVSAPASALSVRLAYFSTGTPPAEQAAYVVDRVGGLEPHDAETVCPFSLATGTYVLDVTFFAGPQAGGDVVAIGQVVVRVSADGVITRADGTPLGTVAPAGLISSVEVLPGQSVTVGKRQDFTFAARGASGGLIGVTPGSAHWALVAGAETLDLEADGTGVGLAAVAGAVVLISGKRTVTGADGSFAIEDLPVGLGGPGVQAGVVRATGFDDKPLFFDVRLGATEPPYHLVNHLGSILIAPRVGGIPGGPTTIRGKVTLEGQASHAGTMVRLLRASDAQELWAMLTAEDGSYGFWVPVGQYRVRAERTGYQTRTIEATVARLDEPITIDIVLTP